MCIQIRMPIVFFRQLAYINKNIKGQCTISIAVLCAVGTHLSSVCHKSRLDQNVFLSLTGKMVQDYWGPSKQLLGEINFIERLKTYDKDNIQPKIMKIIRDTYITNPDFTPQNAAKASSAAEGLCKWVCAMDVYDKVAKEVAPKQERLALAEAEYNEVRTAAIIENKIKESRMVMSGPPHWQAALQRPKHAKGFLVNK